MKSLFLKLLAGTAGCFALSFLFATIGGLSMMAPLVMLKLYKSDFANAKTVTFEKTFEEKGIETLTVKTSAIDVELLPSTSGKLEVTFRGNVSKGGNIVEAGVKGKDATVTTQESGGFTISFNSTSDGLKIYLPPSIKTVKVESSSGDIETEGRLHELKLFQANSSSGDIELEHVDAETVRAEASSGDISLKGKLREVNAQTSSGDIEVENSFADAKMNLHSSSGDVEVQTAHQAKAKLALGTLSGSLRVDGVSHDQKNFAFNGGRGLIEAKTMSGDISVNSENDSD
jgi:DUF4097 and DUF4098 domain-containing protein YvlB